MTPVADPPLTHVHPGRLHSIDALRAGAMLLGVYLHAALAYMYTPHGVSPVVDRSRSFFFDATVVGIHGFRMQLFYVVAGYFAAMLIHRRGLGGFIGNRCKRVLVPMVLAALLVCPLVAWTFIAGRELTGESTAEIGPWAALGQAGRSGRWVLGFGIPMHLWFLWYLMVMCMIAAAVVWLGRKLHLGASRLQAFASWSARSLSGLPVLVLLATVATVPMSEWMIDTPNSWAISPATLGYYGLFFGWGFLVYGPVASQTGGTATSHPGDLGGVGRRWVALLLLAVVSYVLLAIVGGGLTPRWVEARGGRGVAGELVYLPAAAIQAAFTWTVVLASLGLALRYLAHPGPRVTAVVRYLADASYWIYLAHLPIVYLLQVLLVPIPIGAFAKVGLIVMVTAILTLGSYAAFVRHTVIGAWLNGPRPAK